MMTRSSAGTHLPDWPRLMRPELAAAYIGVSPGLLPALGLPSVKVRSLRLYDRAALDRWADALNTDRPSMTADEYLARLDDEDAP